MKLELTVERNDFPGIAEALPQAVGQAVHEIAFQIEADAKGLAPVDTGFLRSSIQTSVIDAFTAEVAVGAHYAAYVEFGTSRMAARPYLTPAVERNRPRLIEALGMLERAL